MGSTKALLGRLRADVRRLARTDGEQVAFYHRSRDSNDFSSARLTILDVRTGVLLTDLILLGVLVAVALRADRGWTFVIAGQQLDTVGAYVVKTINPLDGRRGLCSDDRGLNLSDGDSADCRNLALSAAPRTLEL